MPFVEGEVPVKLSPLGFLQRAVPSSSESLIQHTNTSLDGRMVNVLHFKDIQHRPLGLLYTCSSLVWGMSDLYIWNKCTILKDL